MNFLSEEELESVKLTPEDIQELMLEHQKLMLELNPPKSDGICLRITISEQHELYAMERISGIKEICDLTLDVAPGFMTQQGVVTDKELARISTINNLQRLEVKYMPVTGEFLKYCGSLEKLCSMEIQQCLLEDLFFDYLPIISSLEYLTICGEENFRIPKFDNLLKCKKLRHFSLDCSDYHDDFISRLPSHPTLKSIDLHGNELTGKKLDFLREMCSLKDINLATNKIDDRGVKYLMNSIPPTLDDLGVGSNQITDAAMPIIAENKSIRVLALNYNRGITDKGIQVLGKMQQLRHIFLGNTQVTLEGAKELQETLRKCYISMGDIEGVGKDISLAALEYPEDYD